MVDPTVEHNPTDQPQGAAISSSVDHHRVGEKILVADDDPAVVRLMEFTLRKSGYSVITASDGDEAIALSARELPDLIILDCGMPKYDGFEVCAVLRKNTDFDDVPIIFLTGLTAASEKARAFSIGGTDYITKPAAREELLARVRTHLELANSRRQLRQLSEMRKAKIETQSVRLGQVRTGQTSMLAHPADFARINTAVRFEPAFEAGGDFYEIVELDEGEYGLMVADISGHDLSVAYLTGALKALTASFTSEALSVDETMLMFNTALRKFLDPGRYATASYVKYSKNRQEIDLINAGHPWALFLPAAGRPHYIELSGDILGMHETISCESVRLDVRSGDRLLMFTDGLTEGYHDSAGVTGSRIFGQQQLLKAVEKHGSLSLQKLVDHIVDDLIEECNGTVEDDVVLLGVEF